MWRLLLICALICSTAAQFEQQVRHIILNDANLIESQAGYAMNAPALLANNWKTVSINGDNVQIYTASCQVISLNKQQLSQSVEQQNLINNAKQSLYAVESGQTNQMGTEPNRLGSTRYSLSGNSISTSFSRNLGLSTFSSGGLSVTKYDDNNMSIAKPAGGLPDNILRIFMSNDVVTYVYQDGRVLMRPVACLAANEQQLLQQLRLEVQEAKRKFDLKMQQFQQGMQNMQRNLQMNMQNMQRNLQMNMQNMNNMFQPPFPFYQNQQMRPSAGPQNTMSQYGGSPYGAAFSNGYNEPAAYSQAGGVQTAAGAGLNWPFSQNNSPFYPGFPFGRN